MKKNLCREALSTTTALNSWRDWAKQGDEHTRTIAQLVVDTIRDDDFWDEVENILKKRNTDRNSLPVIVASMYGTKRMVHYLYSKTPSELLDPGNGLDGVSLLNNLITAELCGVAG
ncbi:hypothetical protein HanXRQr2_Chr12g0561861 [Helianthus annuus]|uniref:Uncharacterized protein n=1 Tax=Helianthus annuus TaxID=4232 RepID=A0A9K3HJR8_HELAN|nr:hypothetical protein HanXRQr2_Chr12g0561861 [Helianthus annuus]